MKGFMLDDNGDVVIKDRAIQMVEGNELTRQKVQSVLSTNKGEWPLNTEEGIAFKNILGKSRIEEKQENNALKIYYEKEITHIKDDTSELAKRLEDRLEGRT